MPSISNGSKIVEGEAVRFYYKPWYLVPGLVLWIIVPCGLFLRENRDMKAWAIVLPVFVLLLIYVLLKRVLHLPDSSGHVFGDFTSLLAIAASGVLVYGERLSKYGAGMFWFMLVIFFAGVLAVGYINFAGFNFDNDGLTYTVLFVIWAVSVIVGFLFARRKADLEDRKTMFKLKLLIGTVSASVLCWMFAIFAILLTVTSIDEFGAMIVQGIIIGCVTGVVFFLSATIFVQLAFKNSLYRARLRSLLRINSKQEIVLPPEQL